MLFTIDLNQGLLYTNFFQQPPDYYFLKTFGFSNIFLIKSYKNDKL